MIYNFVKSIRADKLQSEIIAAGLITIDFIDVVDNQVYVNFESELTYEQINLLTTLVNSHQVMTTREMVELKVRNSIRFGEDIIINVTIDNVLAGITASGKTRDVSLYLTNVRSHLRSGSLYAAIDEINLMVSQGIPSNLSPFVTETKLLTNKALIETYISNG